MCTSHVEMGMLTYKIHFKFSNLKHVFLWVFFCLFFSETAHDIQKVSVITFLLKGLLWAPFASVSFLNGLIPSLKCQHLLYILTSLSTLHL